MGGVVLEDGAGAGGVGEEAGGDVADFIDGEGRLVNQAGGEGDEVLAADGGGHEEGDGLLGGPAGFGGESKALRRDLGVDRHQFGDGIGGGMGIQFEGE